MKTSLEEAKQTTLAKFAENTKVWHLRLSLKNTKSAYATVVPFRFAGLLSP